MPEPQRCGREQSTENPILAKPKNDKGFKEQAFAILCFAKIGFITIWPKNLNLGLRHHARTSTLRVRTDDNKPDFSEGKE